MLGTTAEGARIADDVSTRVRLRSWPGAVTVTAEVNYRGLELAQLAE
jgi:hypothetical protein